MIVMKFYLKELDGATVMCLLILNHLQPISLRMWKAEVWFKVLVGSLAALQKATTVFFRCVRPT
jgi:hypothetical protein